jgi:uncharacterized protein YegP (UPF0339 family)
VAGTFEVCQSGTQWRLRLKAANGEIVASGEAYATKASAKEGCAAIQRAAEGATIKEV